MALVVNSGFQVCMRQQESQDFLFFAVTCFLNRRFAPMAGLHVETGTMLILPGDASKDVWKQATVSLLLPLTVDSPQRLNNLRHKYLECPLVSLKVDVPVSSVHLCAHSFFQALTHCQYGHSS